MTPTRSNSRCGGPNQGWAEGATALPWFRRPRPIQAAIAAAREEFTSVALVSELIDFVASTRRGICRDTGSRTVTADGAGAED